MYRFKKLILTLIIIFSGCSEDEVSTSVVLSEIPLPSLATKFIDPSAIVNGIGDSVDSPYNSFAELNALSGSQSADIWAIKRGTQTRSPLLINGVDDITIGSYGSGERPILSGADIITASWTSEGSLYYISDTQHKAIFYGDTRLQKSWTKSALTTDTSWWDSENKRIYISVDFNPNTVEMEKTERKYSVRNLDGENVTIRDLHVTRAKDACILVAGLAVASNPDGSHVIGNLVDYCGAWDGVGKIGMGIKGNNTQSTHSTGHVVKNNEINYSVNNMIETHWLDGALVEGNYGVGSGMGYEIWKKVKNSTYNRNSAYDIGMFGGGHKNLFWLADGEGLGDNVNNLFTNNIGANCENGTVMINDVIANPNTGNKFYNNTFYETGAGGIAAAALVYIRSKAGFENTGNEFKNNIFVDTQGIRFIDTRSVTGTVFENNQYYSASPHATPFRYDESYYNSLADFQSGEDQGANSAEGDPLLIDPVNRDFSLISGSPAIDAGALDLDVLYDFLNNERDKNPDIGAFEQLL